MTPEELERFRQSGITIDREGRFWHEGGEVRHEGMKQAFRRWLDRLPAPDLRYVLRLDANRYVYLTVEDTPLFAASLRFAGARALLLLNDGSEEPLDEKTLTIDDAGILRAFVRDGRIEVRLGTSAATALAEKITWRDGAAWLTAPDGEIRIPRRA